MKLEDKKGQLTVFIILGLVIVSVVLLFLFIKLPSAQIDPKSDPQAYIENCIKGALGPAQEKLLPQAGYGVVSRYILLDEQKVPYLCYTPEDRKLCTILEPLLKKRIEEELKLETQESIDKCFVKLKNSFQNYDYSEGPINYSVEISPNLLKAKISKEIKITRGESTQEFNYFEYSESNPLFDFVILANDILTKETTCNCEHETCSGDVLGLSQLNTKYELELFITGRNEKVYTIRDTISNKEYLFSVRNCIRLP